MKVYIFQKKKRIYIGEIIMEKNCWVGPKCSEYLLLSDPAASSVTTLISHVLSLSSEDQELPDFGLSVSNTVEPTGQFWFSISTVV